jgi:simple sugar transport system substrate-binding protein
MKRKHFLHAACAMLTALTLAACGDNGSTGGGTTTGASTGPGANAGTKHLTIGFAQTGAESDWRAANTASVQAEAAKRGDTLNFIAADGKPDNQIKALQTFIAQGVDVIMLDPLVDTGWTPILKEAKAAKIPVIIADRRIDSPEDLYVTFVGSDFIEEGKRAGEWLVKKTGGKAVIAELQGSLGAAPANDRKKGFEDAIKSHPDMKIVLSQTGEFTRAKGKEVMETFLKSAEGKNITALFAHNDDMALGAIQAIKDAGKQPGKDIIVVSVDGVKAALEAISRGEINCTVECNPLLGPTLFDMAHKIAAGQEVPKTTYSKEELFDETNVKEALPNRKY